MRQFHCYSILCLFLVFLSCNQYEDQKPSLTPEGIASSEDPYARINFEKSKLINPLTGEIPNNMRARELSFVNNLQRRSSKTNNVNWDSRGPYNVGGRTRALALDIDDENIILAGGVTGGMWRSDNGGVSFVKTTTPDQFQSVTCVAQDRRPGKSNIWYYGTGEYYGVISAASFSNQASGNGIFKSTDGGQSWQMLQSTVSNTPTTLYENGDFDFVWNIVTDHTDTMNDAVYAAVINGVYRSLDGGQSWQAVLGLDTNSNNISRFSNVIITSEGIFYAALNAAGAAGGIWRSADGLNWTEITPANFPNSYRRTVMAAVPSDENQVYFLSETPNSGALDHNLWHYTYLSGDGSDTGGVWENRTANLPNYKCEVFYDFTFGSYNSQSSYDMCIAVQPGNPDHVFIGGTDVFRSTDGFTSQNNHRWIGGYQCDTATPSNYIYPDHHPDIHGFLFLPSDSSILFTASDGGVHKTLNCLAPQVDWVSLNNGYVTSQFYTVAIEDGEVDNDILVGGMQDNGTFFTNSSDPGQQWKHVFYGDGAYAAIEEGRNNYYLSWQTGKTFKFKIDDQGNEIGKTRIDPVGASDHLFINPFILDPGDQNRMYLAAGRYVWRNNDLDSIPITGNETSPISDYWEIISESITPFGTRISSLIVPPTDNQTLFYGTTSGRIYRMDSILSVNRTRTIVTPPTS
ncbi:MAG: flagellar basal body rod modification protein, partial [Chitinophagales bacterium]|nr:flagellar basal body rod modification protein [Chitinophagales bacterium]